jgi:hypothetical protein
LGIDLHNNTVYSETKKILDEWIKNLESISK